MTYDSDQGGSFIVTKPDGNVREFKPTDSGLHFLDITTVRNDVKSIRDITISAMTLNLITMDQGRCW